MPNLEYIDASFSKMKHFKGFTALQKLKTLVVSEEQSLAANKNLDGVKIIIKKDSENK